MRPYSNCRRSGLAQSGRALRKTGTKSPYEFSVIGIEILGQVYEQFLGKVIKLTDGHRAKVEPKPEVRKAGGVYYTPIYISKQRTESAYSIDGGP